MVIKLKLFCVFLTLFFIAGCFTYEETIIINEDGSGRMMVHYYGLKKSDIDSDDINLYLGNEEEIRYKILDDYTTDKVKLTDFYVRERGTSKHVYFTVEFPSFSELNKTYKFRRNPVIFRRDDEIYFRRVFEFDDDPDFAHSENGFEAFIKSAVKETVLDRIKFKFEVEMPERVLDSNSNRMNLKKVALWKYTLGDLLVHGDAAMWVQGR